MVRNRIQIGIPCGINCEYYVDFLLRTLYKTTSAKDDIEILFGVSDYSVNMDHIDSKRFFDYKVIDAYGDTSGSIGHGKCLDVIFAHMDSEYGMFVDCDVAFLENGWNEKFMECLDDRIVIVGTEYDGAKYLKFPNVVCCLFRTQVLKDVNVVFGVPPRKIKVSVVDANLYGRKVGDSILLDTGSELPLKLKTAGYDGVALPLVRLNDKGGMQVVPVFLKDGLRGEEYHLNGRPMLTHIGRSLTRDFCKDEIVIKWRQEVERWIEA